MTGVKCETHSPIYRSLILISFHRWHETFSERATNKTVSAPRQSIQGRGGGGEKERLQDVK